MWRYRRTEICLCNGPVRDFEDEEVFARSSSTRNPQCHPRNKIYKSWSLDVGSGSRVMDAVFGSQRGWPDCPLLIENLPVWSRYLIRHYSSGPRPVLRHTRPPPPPHVFRSNFPTLISSSPGPLALLIIYYLLETIPLMTVISHMALRLPTGTVLPARPSKAFVLPLSWFRNLLLSLYRGTLTGKKLQVMFIFAHTWITPNCC